MIVFSLDLSDFVLEGKMKLSTFNFIISFIFGVVFCAHFAREVFGLTVVIGDIWVVPMWVSAVAATLAVWISMCALIFAIHTKREGK